MDTPIEPREDDAPEESPDDDPRECQSCGPGQCTCDESGGFDHDAEIAGAMARGMS